MLRQLSITQYYALSHFGYQQYINARDMRILETSSTGCCWCKSAIWRAYSPDTAYTVLDY